MTLLADQDLAAPFPPNTMLDEKYRLDELLEVGGMGAVYVGTHTKLQKKVAIKVLRKELADSPDMIERFQREAVAASRIGHESIVDVSDLGTTADGSPFLVMEYLVGETLADRIRSSGPMAPMLACAIAREILDAIAAAHRASIIHRDLKPENIYLVRGSRGESVKILDFGISRVIEARAETANDARLTATGQIMGTPYYMAPEQAAGQSDLTGLVDVYATGVILYEMLSGEVPFDAGNYNTIIFKVLSGDYQPLSARLAGLPQPLDAVVNRAMALRPEERFTSADEFAAALLPFASDAMSSSQPLPLAAQTSAASSSVGFAPTMTPNDLSRLPSAVVRSTQYGGHSRGTPHSQAMTSAQPGPAQPGPQAIHPGASVPMPHSSSPSVITAQPGFVDTSGKSRRVALIAALLVLLGGGVAAAIVLTQSSNQNQPALAHPQAEVAAEGSAAEEPTPSVAAPIADAAPQAVAADAAQKTVTLTFELSPRDATVRVDGKRVRDGELTLVKSERDVDIEVRRRGYETKTRSIRLDQSRAVEVVLEKKRKAGTSKGGKTGKRIIGDSPYD